jgi:hypothetical protein
MIKTNSRIIPRAAIAKTRLRFFMGEEVCSQESILSAYFTEGRAWADFESLEAQIDELEAYVTIEPRNGRCYSRKIGLMLFQVASQVEAFFKQALLDNSLDVSRQINQARLSECRTKSANNQQIGIGEYRDVFDQHYQLPNGPLTLVSHFFNIVKFSLSFDLQTSSLQRGGLRTTR